MQVGKEGYFEQARSRMDAQRQMDGRAIHKTLEHFSYSNELLLGLFEPVYKAKRSAIIGVGSGQVLDFLANSSSTQAYSIDHNPVTSWTLRLMLEAGLSFATAHERFPNSAEYPELFRTQNLNEWILPLIDNQVISPEEAGYGTLPFRVKLIDPFGNRSDMDYPDYLITRRDIDFAGALKPWYSTSDGIAKVLDLYSQGRVKVVGADMANQRLMRQIKRDMGTDEVGLAYFSNIESYLGFWQVGSDKRALHRLWKALGFLPWAKDADFLRTIDFSSGIELAKLPPEVKQSENLSFISMDWHYNHQSRLDWQKKVALDPGYVNNGWRLELNDNNRGGYSELA